MNEITLRHQFTGAGTSPPYRVTGPALLVQTDGLSATLQGSNLPEDSASWQDLGVCTGYTPLKVTTSFAHIRVVGNGAGVVAVSGAAAPAAGAGGGGGGSSDTTEATQLAVKTAVEAINTKTPALAGGKTPVADADNLQMMTNVAARLGATDDAPPANDTGTSSLIGLIKRVLQRLTILVTGGQPLDNIIDEATAGTTYICEAPIGTASSAAAWRVQRVTVVSSVTTIRWAGTGAFDQIANNRAALTYA